MANATATESFVRIIYTQQNKLTPAEKTAREQLKVGLNQVLQWYMQKSRLQDVLAIELFPCDDDCSDCEA